MFRGSCVCRGLEEWRVVWFGVGENCEGVVGRGACWGYGLRLFFEWF